jgi:hypothetical protein
MEEVLSAQPAQAARRRKSTSFIGITLELSGGVAVRLERVVRCHPQ